MSYLTDAEQAEIRIFNTLFESEGWRLFVTKNSEIRDLLPMAALRAENDAQLNFIKGQYDMLSQVVNYEATYTSSIQAVEQERQVEAAEAAVDAAESLAADA